MVIVAVNYRMHLNLIRIIGLDARMYVREGNGHKWSLLLFLSNLALICIISFTCTFCTFDNSYLFLIVFFRVLLADHSPEDLYFLYTSFGSDFSWFIHDIVTKVRDV